MKEPITLTKEGVRENMESIEKKLDIDLNKAFFIFPESLGKALDIQETDQVKFSKPLPV